MRIVILGLSITSSWGNGHATTYRGLVRGLVKREHDVLFLERDKPWYASNRDLKSPPFGRTELYSSISDLKKRFTSELRAANFVIVGSFVPEGVLVGEWVMATAKGPVAFYDIDTPVTLAKLDRGDTEYISPALVARYDLYLSFTGGPTLQKLQKKYGSPQARVLYCSVDETNYFPEEHRVKQWDLGYLGTYSDDRQPVLERLMLIPASRWKTGKFAVAGAMYPESIEWPENVQRIEHLAPANHRSFYNSQRLTLNVTRADMVRAGYSPSVRLFEAAACGVPIISDYWDGLGEVFSLGKEILVSKSPKDTLHYLQECSEKELAAIGHRARTRVLSEHTSDHRAAELEAYALEITGTSADATPLHSKHADLRSGVRLQTVPVTARP
jgi:spore maturation protein CgeB